MSDQSPSNREPSLGGEHAPRLTSNEPALSMEHLLPGLRDAFTSESRNTRTDIIDALTNNSQTAAPVLIQLLRGSSDAKTRQRSAAILGQIRDERAVPALIEALTDTDASIRKVVVWALGQIGSKDAVESLLALLERETDGRIMRAALQSVAQVADISAWHALVRLTENDDANIAAAAFTAARAVGRSCTLQLYVDLLHDPTPILRTWAAEWATISEPVGIEQLGLIERLISYEERADVQRRGVWLLGQIDAAEANQRLLDLTRNGDDHVRMAGIRALGHRLTLETIGFLLELYPSEIDRNQSAILEAVGGAEDPRIVPFLLDCIESGGQLYSATNQLEARNIANTDQLLLDRLGRADGEARNGLIRALRSFPTDEVNAVLMGIIRGLGDEHERSQAVHSLRLDLFPEDVGELETVLHADASDDVRSSILWEVASSEHPEAEAILRRFLASTTEDMVRTYALHALGSREIEDRRELVLEQLGKIKDEDALANIVNRLGWLEPEEQASKLISFYDLAKTVALRHAVVYEFEHVQHPELISFLRRVSQTDSSAWVRCTAVWNLYYEAAVNDEALQVIVSALADEGVSEADYSNGEWRVCDAAADCLERLLHYNRSSRLAGAASALEAWRLRQPNQSSDTSE